MTIFSYIIFWGSFSLIIYAYFGYPLILKILSGVRFRPIIKGDILPKVSYIVAAYNEAGTIFEKIKNILELDYPHELLEVIVASDCSDDGTDEIAETFQDRGVKLVRLSYHGGKEAVQAAAIGVAEGEILIFSDVATRNSPDAIKKVVRNFADPTVGCVSSEDRIIDDNDDKQGESIYVKYEMLLRRLETKVNTVVGLSGSFFAVRRELCGRWAIDLASDLNTLLNSVRRGLRGINDPEVIGYYRNVKSSKAEQNRKIRTVLRGIAVFMASTELLNPFEYGLFAWQLFSHKLCRWLVPFALVAMLLGNVLLMETATVYRFALIGQVVFYLMAFSGFMIPRSEGWLAVRISKYFLVVNVSIAIAWFKYFSGQRSVAWKPSKR